MEQGLDQEERRDLINKDAKTLSIRRQCVLLRVNRSTLYYSPVRENEQDILLMNLMDQQYTLTPFYGTRRMTAWLRRQGHNVNRKRVRRLMRKTGLWPIYRKRNLSKRNHQHKIYPYLLEGLAIDRPGMVWAADLTYICMAKGFVYMVAIIDWHSRYVLSWRLSTTLDRNSVEALKDALANHPAPETRAHSSQPTTLPPFSKTVTLRLVWAERGLLAWTTGTIVDCLFNRFVWSIGARLLPKLLSPANNSTLVYSPGNAQLLMTSERPP